MSTNGPTIDIEKTNLEAHVDLCALRYESLDKRLSSIEVKFDKLQGLIEHSHSSMAKIIIGTAGTIITGVISLVLVLMMKH
jgi:hypothetical protein